MKRVGLTGGRGRLAPLIARHLRAEGLEVRMFSRCAGEGLEALEELVRPASWAHLDGIVHCGWSSVPLTAERDPGITAREDVPFLQEMLRAAAEAGSNPHWIFLSTGAVYGNTGVEPATESAVPEPLGAYARGKWEAEKVLSAEAKESAVLRISNLLGEKPDPARPQGILPRLIHAAKTGEEVALWGDGRATKDYLHCQDFLTALTTVLTQRRVGILNVSRGESVSLLDLVAQVETLAGHKLRIRHEPHFDWDVAFSRISSQKLQEQTGWTPTLSVRDAVEECFSRFS